MKTGFRTHTLAYWVQILSLPRFNPAKHSSSLSLDFLGKPWDGPGSNGLIKAQMFCRLWNAAPMLYIPRMLCQLILLVRSFICLSICETFAEWMLCFGVGDADMNKTKATCSKAHMYGNISVGIFAASFPGESGHSSKRGWPWTEC